MKGQHPVWKAATLIEEGKNKSAPWAELLVAPMFGFLLTHGKCSNGLVIWSGRWAMESWSIKGTPYGVWLYKSLGM